MFVVSVIV